jgi:hypothetical protein
MSQEKIKPATGYVHDDSQLEECKSQWGESPQEFSEALDSPHAEQPEEKVTE